MAAAKHASCGYLLTEDLQAGQEIDGVMVVDPFRTGPGNFPNSPARCPPHASSE